MKRVYRGGCHCGRVVMEVEADFEVEPVVVCNCSMCARKGFLHLIVEPGRFRLVQGDEALREYRFGTRVAVHKFCETCGVHAFYTPRSHPDHVDVNVRCLEGVGPVRYEAFDGQRWEENIEGLWEKV